MTIEGLEKGTLGKTDENQRCELDSSPKSAWWAIRIAAGRRMCGQAGFTMFEMAVTVMILGIVLMVSTLSYQEVNRGMRMTAAKKQVEEAINRAKTAARQENVTYRVVFYSSSDPYPNCYEFYCNTEKSEGVWELAPVDKSVSGENVIYVEGEPEHWYIQVSNGVEVEEGVQITISPRGTELNVTPGEVRLRIGRETGKVVVDKMGRTTLQ